MRCLSLALSVSLLRIRRLPRLRLAMTVVVGGRHGFALVDSVTKVVLRDGTQAVPYNEIRRAVAVRI